MDKPIDLRNFDKGQNSTLNSVPVMPMFLI